MMARVVTAGRRVALAISAAYALFGILLAAPPIVFFSGQLLMVQERPAAGSLLIGAGVVAFAAIFGAAAFGLFRERPWSRWMFLAIALLSLALPFRAVPLLLEVHDNYSHPLEGAFHVLTKDQALQLALQLVVPGIGLPAVAIASAWFVWRRFRPGDNRRLSPGSTP
jgi:hypothetical protein